MIDSCRQKSVLRILDVNLNRLREALRVIEEYVRFIDLHETLAAGFKGLRHALQEIETGLGREALIDSRDVETDPFAQGNRPEELMRGDESDIVSANFKRAQEAARVIEEYVKITNAPALSEKAKNIRFSLYELEKKFMKQVINEQKRRA